MGRPVSRSGMTIIELVVVIAIIAVLITLTLPAVNAAIEGSRQRHCGAKQTRFAFAMARHNSYKNALPGWRNSLKIVNRTPNSTVTWFVASLPYLDRKDAYAGVENANVWLLDTNYVNSGHHLSELSFCPTVSGEILLARPFGISYQANGAGGSNGVSAFNRDDGALGDNANNNSVSLDDIRDADGLSSTLLTSEQQLGFWALPTWPPYTRTIKRNYPNPDDPVTGRPHGGNGNMSNAADAAACGGVCDGSGCWRAVPDQVSAIDGGGIGGSGGLCFGILTSGALTASTQIIGTSSGRLPSSWHPTGVYASFADGSTRFLSTRLPVHIYGQLLTSRSIWNDATQTYSNNSARMNAYLKCPPAPATQPYVLKPQDY